jgi:gliding motility-associated-like protein
MKLLFLMILGMTIAHPVFAQTVVYVTPGGAGVKDGSSWTNAYDSKAFALAALTAVNTQFWLAAGTYYPSYDVSGNAAPADPRTACFSLEGSNVSVYGGFAGTETAFSQRNIRTNLTIFSGDIGTPGNNSDNSYHVWTLLNAGAAGLDGCTITAGNANSLPYSEANANDFGGGVADDGGEPVTIDSCLIINNNSVWGGGGGDFAYAGTINMTNNVISNNTCYDGVSYGTGGGIQLDYGEVLTATQCVFANNDAGGPEDEGGGGLMVYSAGSAATLIQCTFLNNITPSTVRPGSGAISVDAGVKLTLENTLIWANEATVMYAVGATVTEQNSIVKGLYESPSWVTEAILFADSASPVGPDGLWRTADDGVRLRTCSPAINKGDNGYATWTEDITNQPRVYNTTVDIGAYEFQAVNPIVTPSITITPSLNPSCPGSLVQFSTTSGGGGVVPLYQWEVNGSNVADVSATFASSDLVNGDIVNCIMTSTDACDYGDTVSSPIAILLADTPSVMVTATDNDVCAGNPISMSASVTAAGAGPVFQWSVNGTASDSSGSTYNSSGLQNGDIVTCTLTPGTGACGSTPVVSNAVQVVVYPLPSVSVSPADTSVPYGTGLTLSAVTSSDVVSWQWTPTGSAAPDLTILDETTEQTYTLTVQTANHCSAEAKAVVNIYPVLRMPSGFTPNGDGHNDIFRVPPGVQLNLEGLSVYDRWGVRVFYTRDPDIGWDGSVGGHPAPAGAYVYQLLGSNDKGSVNIQGTVLLIR